MKLRPLAMTVPTGVRPTASEKAMSRAKPVPEYRNVYPPEPLPPLLYHITPGAYIHKIASEGLKPDTGNLIMCGSRHRWDKWGHQPIWLATRPEVSINFVGEGWYEERHAVTLAVITDGLTGEKDEQYKDTYVYHELIGTNRIFFWKSKEKDAYPHLPLPSLDR